MHTGICRDRYTAAWKYQHCSDRREKGTSRENVEFSCTKIGEMKNGEYILKDEFLSSKVELNALKTADDMEKAANKLAEMDIQGEKVLLTDKNGKLCFSG